MNTGRTGKAFYPPEDMPPSIILDDEVLDHRLHAQLFHVSGPRDRIVIRKNYPETWFWHHTLAGYTHARACSLALSRNIQSPLTFPPQTATIMSAAGEKKAKFIFASGFGLTLLPRTHSHTHTSPSEHHFAPSLHLSLPASLRLAFS